MFGCGSAPVQPETSYDITLPLPPVDPADVILALEEAGLSVCDVDCDGNTCVAIVWIDGLLIVGGGHFEGEISLDGPSIVVMKDVPNSCAGPGDQNQWEDRAIPPLVMHPTDDIEITRPIEEEEDYTEAPYWHPERQQHADESL